MASAVAFVRDLTPKGKARNQELRSEANALMVQQYSKSGTVGGAYSATNASSLGEINEKYVQ
jgi:hypothetical protein